MSDKIDIKGLDKGAVVAALYNASRPLGMGMLHYDPSRMSAAEASTYAGDYIDYLKGRVMKVDVRGDSFDPWLYDRDNGSGAAVRVIDEVRAVEEMGV